MKTQIAVALLLMAALDAKAVNRCTRPGGEVVYQAGPCGAADSARTLDVRPAAGHSSPETDLEAMRRNAVSAAIVRGEPINTMTLGELERAMGRPDKINAANYGRGVEEQRIYYRPGATWLVYTEQGRVRAVQRNDGGAPAAVPVAAPVKQCPGRREIWDLEVKASSIEIRGTQLQRDLERRLEEMRQCR